MAAARKGATARGAAKQAPAKGKTLVKAPLAKLSATTAVAATTATATAPVVEEGRCRSRRQ